MGSFGGVRGEVRKVSIFISDKYILVSYIFLAHKYIIASFIFLIQEYIVISYIFVTH